MLAIGLEDEFSFPVLLDIWIGNHDGPHALTVGSLCSYMIEVEGAGAQSVPG